MDFEKARAENRALQRTVEEQRQALDNLRKASQQRKNPEVGQISPAVDSPQFHCSDVADGDLEVERKEEARGESELSEGEAGGGLRTGEGPEWAPGEKGAPLG